MWRVFFFPSPCRAAARRQDHRGRGSSRRPAGKRSSTRDARSLRDKMLPLPPKCPSTFQVLSEEAGPGLPVTFPEADSQGNPGPLAVREYTQLGAPEPALHRTGDRETVATGPWPPNRPSNGGGGSCPGGSHAKSPRLQAACPGRRTSPMWTPDSLHDPDNPRGSLFPPLLCTPSLQG